MIQGLHHVGIVVADLAAAERLLAEVLGLTSTRRLSLPGGAAEIAFFQCGAVELELIEVADPDQRRARLGPDGTKARIEHVALEVDNLEAATDDLASAGARFTTAAGQTAESREPLTAIGTRSLFTMPDSTAGLMLQIIQRLEE